MNPSSQKNVNSSDYVGSWWENNTKNWIFASRNFHQNKAWKSIWQSSWKEKTCSQMHNLQWEILVETKNIICQFMMKKVCSHIFYFQQKIVINNMEECISDFYKTVIWLKNVLTLVYTSGVAQTKNGQNFKSWSCQTNTVEYWAASNNLNS